MSEHGEMNVEFVSLDPSCPLCWENDDTLRMGFETALVRLRNPTAATQRFVGELRKGVEVNALRSVALRCGLRLNDYQQLLELLDPVLIRGRSQHPSVPPRSAGSFKVAVPGDGKFIGWLRAACNGYDPQPEKTGTAPDFAIVADRYLSSASRAQSLLSDDIPHVSVVLTDRSLMVGPLVPPGGAPCLSCIELHRLETEPLSSVLAAQLLMTAPPTESEVCAKLAASLALTAFSQWQVGQQGLTGCRLRIPVCHGLPAFTSSVERISPHADCGCALFHPHPELSGETHAGFNNES